MSGASSAFTPLLKYFPDVMRDSHAAIGIDSIFPPTHEGQFSREAESLAAAIALNIWEDRHEAHQKHEGHNRKFTRLSASFEILPPVSLPPSRKSKVVFLRIIFSLSINIWRLMTVKNNSWRYTLLR